MAQLVEWGDMKRQFLVRQRNPNTRKAYQKTLTGYRAYLQKYDKSLHPVTSPYRELRAAIEDWAFTSTVSIKATTMSSRLGAVSSFYKFLIEEDIVPLSKNPAAGVAVWENAPPKRPAFPDAVLADRLEACLKQDTRDGTLTSERNYLMFLFLTEGGFRASELCNIKLQDVEESKVVVTRGKGFKTRTTAVTPETCALLTEFAGKHSLEPDDFIFMPRHMYKWDIQRKHRYKKGVKPISVDALAKMLKQGAIRHGFTEKEVKLLQKPHGFRHLWAVRHVAAGTQHIFIMMMGGWNNMQMLKYYINHASFEVKAVERK